ncbi:MAG: sulfur carrier protein ThiS [Bradymonadales bacterium]|nr:sulfur carrier protein ThiS [Bradymonadales bacterium]
MKLVVNGRPMDLPQGLSLFDLLHRLDLSSDRPGMAIALNDEVLSRESWSSIALAQGDRIEIIQAVCGG